MTEIAITQTYKPPITTNSLILEVAVGFCSQVISRTVNDVKTEYNRLNANTN